MLAVLTPEEMGAADRGAIAAGTPVEVLMDRAGRAVAWDVRRRLGRTYGVRAVIACGKGNNGGDGLVAARVLRGWGARVDIVMVGEGIDAAAFARHVARADVVIDAMYGTGFRGELTGDARSVADAYAAFTGPVIAVDIPSGVDGLTGAVPGLAVRADATVCFAAMKPGLCFEPGRTLAGDVHVVDIGIAVTDGDAPPRTFCTEPADLAAWLPPRAPAAHKWNAACFVVGGSGGMTGAPLLASHAAMRAGAGMVWCGVPGADAAARASGSEVITKGLPADADGALTEDAATTVLASAARFGALAIGPGLGRSPGTGAAVRRLVAEAAGPVVLDADALHALAGHLDLLASRTVPAVLTPHAGEYAALRGEAPGPDRLAAARALAAETGAVVLLKGPGTVVAHPDGRAAICLRGGPVLATAGTGDVLTGIVGAFLARGVPPFEAATAAAFVHGSAADGSGHTGLVAGDLVDAIPSALDALAV
ncbi:MAG: NAD(P)H-hydrate dehydratase [Acidimicrobiia bacterium]